MSGVGQWVRENYYVVDPPYSSRTNGGNVEAIDPKTGEMLYTWPEGGFIPVQLQALYNGRPEKARLV